MSIASRPEGSRGSPAAAGSTMLILELGAVVVRWQRVLSLSRSFHEQVR
jgi:hypothetical protein